MPLNRRRPHQLLHLTMDHRRLAAGRSLLRQLLVRRPDRHHESRVLRLDKPTRFRQRVGRSEQVQTKAMTVGRPAQAPPGLVTKERLPHCHPWNWPQTTKILVTRWSFLRARRRATMTVNPFGSDDIKSLPHRQMRRGLVDCLMREQHGRRQSRKLSPFPASVHYSIPRWMPAFASTQRPSPLLRSLRELVDVAPCRGCRNRGLESGRLLSRHALVSIKENFPNR
mmetsp:Transcript_362/g.1185  ORF Transcript_362/g.1185 Transcript_362/m.1185 type:complete len:225 (-) Transcript_362:5541-6215(-)